MPGTAGLSTVASVARSRLRRSPGRWGRRLALGTLALLLALIPATAVSAEVARGPATVPMALSALTPAMTASSVPSLLSGTMAVSSGRVGGRALQTGVSATPSKTKPYWACPEGPCNAIIDPRSVRASGRWALPAGGPLLEGGGELGGYDPQDLQLAYNIPTSGGSTHTVALVDAYGYEAAEADLAAYRQRYGLGPCTTASGCFTKVNQKGEQANYPAPSREWEGESALDLDMASAACPSCRILLVEANSAAVSDLGMAVNTAAALGATEISNSYSIAEEGCGASNCEEFNADYNHPGVLVTASSGDAGYDNYQQGAASASFPASSPYVVAVGGTSLKKAANSRGWTEAVWSEPERHLGTGSGCSRSEPKPIWQTDTVCAHRTGNDVAAVAACETPVSVYSTPYSGWQDVCGTSASSPLVAGIEAHASEYARSLPGASAFYADLEAGFDVTAGDNEGLDGECVLPPEDEYFCHAEIGYDGPTGNGTPNGPLALAGAPPLVATNAASAVTGTAATLNGTVDPQGSEATYRFEYGTTQSYGTSVPVGEAAAGSGTSGKAVSQAVTGLQPQAVYHYRLVATNGQGTTTGADSTFETAPPSVTGVEPDSGPTDGGTTVTISGSGFLGAIAVKFGSTAAKSFTVESETSIRAVSAAGSGTKDVTVTTPAGSSSTHPPDLFAYKLGPVLGWGPDRFGQLGDGMTANSNVPVEVSALPEAVALAAGNTHSLGLLKDGTVMAWGENGDGELGDGSRRNSNVPVAVCAAGVTKCPGGPYLDEVAAIAAGVYDSLALLKDGTVMAWGNNYQGQLGNGTSTVFKGIATEFADVPTPVCVVAETPCRPENYLKDVVAISAGGYHSVALLSNGTVMAWGDNQQGQLGIGTTTGPEKCDEGFFACSRTPVAIGGMAEATAVAAGQEHSLALLRDGTVRAWGSNEFGRLGDGSEEGSAVPMTVCAAGEKAPCAQALTDVEAIAAGWENGFALLKGGTVKAWGENFEGELGDGTFSGESCKYESPCSRAPVAVSNLSEVTAIASGVDATDSMARLSDGSVMTWGTNSGGALGAGVTSLNSDVPVAVCAAGGTGPCPGGPYLNGEVTAMAVGGDHSLVSTAPPSAPTVVTGSGSSLGQTTAVVSATVDPHGGTVSDCHFDYGASSAYGASVPCSSLPGSGRSPVAVAASLTGLSPNTSYHFRIVASNPGGTSYGADQGLTTLPNPPTVVTGSASAVTPVSATLAATVNPNGGTVSSCVVEYGTALPSGTSDPCSPDPGSGSSAVGITASVTALAANTTYQYRVVAINSGGSSAGSPQSFTTPGYVPPEFGRCVSVAAGSGKYSSSSCTAPGGKDAYEWEHGVGKTHFSTKLAAGAVTLATTAGTNVTCTDETGSGEYFGLKTVGATVLRLTGCAELGQKCASSGAGAGEVASRELEGELGVEKLGATSAKNKIALDLFPAGRTGPVAEMTCGSTTVALRGSVIVPLKANKMQVTQALKFKASKGKQKPERFVGGPKDVLEASLNGGAFLQAGLTAALTQTSEEPVEVNSVL